MSKKEKVREQLIKAVREAFRAKGYANTTMDDLAQATGKAKSTLYYYFENKEDAFRAVVKYEGETLRNELLKIIDDPVRTASEKLEDYVLFRWKAFETLVNYYRTLRKEFLENIEFVEKYRKHYDEIEKQLIGRILRLGIEQSEFRISLEDVEMVSLTLVLSMKALEIPFFVDENTEVSGSKIKSLLNILFYGIVTK